jgi:hypothetical protein
MNDPVIDLVDRVAQLPRATVAPDRARRTQARCHRILARHAPLHGVLRPRRWPSWSPAVIGLATLYFAEAMWHAVRAYVVR